VNLNEKEPACRETRTFKAVLIYTFALALCGCAVKQPKRSLTTFDFFKPGHTQFTIIDTFNVVKSAFPRLSLQKEEKHVSVQLDDREGALHFHTNPAINFLDSLSFSMLTLEGYFGKDTLSDYASIETTDTSNYFGERWSGFSVSSKTAGLSDIIPDSPAKKYIRVTVGQLANSGKCFVWIDRLYYGKFERNRNWVIGIFKKM